jgi:hypothetical protein
MRSGIDWTELGLSGPAAFLFTPPIANLIEERTRAIAISIIKIFIEIHLTLSVSVFELRLQRIR